MKSRVKHLKKFTQLLNLLSVVTSNYDDRELQQTEAKYKKGIISKTDM